MKYNKPVAYVSFYHLHDLSMGYNMFVVFHLVSNFLIFFSLCLLSLSIDLHNQVMYFHWSLSYCIVPCINTLANLNLGISTGSIPVLHVQIRTRARDRKATRQKWVPKRFLNVAWRCRPAERYRLAPVATLLLKSTRAIFVASRRVALRCRVSPMSRQLQRAFRVPSARRQGSGRHYNSS